MIAIKSKILFLIVCFIEAIWLLFAQVSGSMILLIPCLVCFLGLAVWGGVKGMVMPVFLFFLPFAPLLKLQPGTISFYTIALLAVYLVCLVLGSRSINIYHFVPGLVLISLILVVKTVYGYQIDNNLILFSASLLLVPFITRELGEKYDFYWLTLFFSFGIIIAAVTAPYLSVYSTIARYIETHDLLGSVRYSGYYGDPNFYSSHFTTALSGVLVLLLSHRERKTFIPLIIVAMALLYCGIMSLSKTFFLLAVSILLFWGVEFFFKKGKLSEKLMIILTLAVGLLFLIFSTVFTDLVDMVISRFLLDRDLSDLTTRRTDLWLKYLKAFAEDPLLLLFGKGYTKVLIGDRTSHNSLIQIVYQLGLVGSAVFCVWSVFFTRTFLEGFRIRRENLTQLFVLLIGAFGSWMSLDFLFFDEFFLIPLYVFLGISFIVEKEPHQYVMKLNE